MGFLTDKRYHIVLFAVLFFLAIAVPGRSASAATATVSAASVSAVTGDTVTVTVSVKSSDTIGGADVYISYNTSILEFVSGTDVTDEGSGSLYWLAFDMSSSVSELSVTLTFKALAAGTSAIEISSSTEVYDENANNITYTSSNGKVTVTTPSTDATLSALKVTGTTGSGSSSAITLSPSFSKNTTSYTATVESNITTAVTTATANSSKASVSISDTSLSLKTGTNTVTVKVTAESGATKTYTITITKKQAETTTTAETTTEETTTEETTTEETTSEETTEEETTAVGQILVTVAGQTRILLAEFDESLLPEGFEMTEIIWEDEVIAAGQGIYKELTLVCTADEAGENPQLYILQADGSLLVLRNYQTNAVLYTILELPDAEAPEGFQTATLIMETDYDSEDEIAAWQSVACSDYYLVYAMNWNGESGYYLYDSGEKTFQRYAADVAGGTTDPSVEETAAEAGGDADAAATPADATPTDDGTADGSSSGIWKYIVMLLEAAVIVLLAVLLILTKRRGKGPDGGDTSAEDAGGGNLPQKDTGEGNLPGGESDEEDKSKSGVENHGISSREAWSERKWEGEQPDRNPEGNDFSEEEDAGEDTMSLKDYFSEFDEMLEELDDSMKK